MDEKQETIADIVAEIRLRGDTPREHTRPDGYGGYETITINRNEYLISIADRIEAAMKREQNAKRDIVITANGDALMNAYNALDEADGIIRRSMNRIKNIANISIKNEGR